MRLIIFLLLVSCVVAGCGGKSQEANDEAPKDPKLTSLQAHLNFTMTEIGVQKTPLPYQQMADHARCTKSIPATCQSEIVCNEMNQEDLYKNGCDYLEKKQEELFRPLDKKAVCTQIYGGPEKMHITGEVNGEKIDIKLSRENGCGIAQWDLHRPLWV